MPAEVLSNNQKLHDSVMVLFQHNILTFLDLEVCSMLVDWEPDEWTPSLCRMAWNVCRKYRSRLEELGVPFESLEEPICPFLQDRLIAWCEIRRRFVLKFPKDHQLIGLVRQIPGRKFDPKELCWTLPNTAASARAMLDLAEEYEFAFQGDSLERAHEIIENSGRLFEASKASSSSMEVDGLGGELRPFQKAGVAYLLNAKRAILADEMGLGKTVQALAALQAANAFPALIVCPASLKLNWKREAGKWLPGRRIFMLEKRDSMETGLFGFIYFRGYDLFICNYELLDGKSLKPSGHGDSSKRKESLELTGNSRVLQDLGLRAVIFDEFHYCKDRKSQRCKVSRELARNVEYRFGLTGTPIINRPEELIPQLEILNRLEDFGGSHQFWKKYCELQSRMGSAAPSLLKELNTELRERCFIRRKKADVLKELPPIQTAVVPLEIDNREEYNKAYQDVASWLVEQALKDEGLQKSLSSETEKRTRELIENSIRDKGGKTSYAEEIIRINVLKQLAAKGKLLSAKLWIQNFMDTGEKLVAFANHVNVARDLAKTFQAPCIIGEVKKEERMGCIDRFQADPACRLIVLNQTGQEGLTLTAASNVAHVEFPWTPSAMDQRTARLHRYGQEKSITSWYLVGVNTIDEDIIELIDQKRCITRLIHEGEISDEQSPEGSILNDLIQRIRKGSKVESENHAFGMK